MIISRISCIEFESKWTLCFLVQKSWQNISLTRKTNIRTLRLCARFKYDSFYLRLQSFQSLFGSLLLLVLIAVGSISIDYKTASGALELNYVVFETFHACLFWHPWVALKAPLIDSATCTPCYLLFFKVNCIIVSTHACLKIYIFVCMEIFIQLSHVNTSYFQVNK